MAAAKRSISKHWHQQKATAQRQTSSWRSISEKSENSGVTIIARRLSGIFIARRRSAHIAYSAASAAREKQAWHQHHGSINGGEK